MKHLIAFLGIFPLALSCVGTEIGNPPATEEGVKVDFVVHSFQEAQIGNLSLSEKIELEEATLVVSALRFRKCMSDESDAFRSDSFLAELLKKDHLDTRVKIENGDYCRLDIQPIRGGEDGIFAERPELDGSTLYAAGTYDGIRLSIRYEGDDEISFLGSFSINSPTDRVFVAIDLKKWFLGIDLSSAEMENDHIVIGDGQNSDIMEKLAKNFESSIRVGVDQNDNGVLEQRELSAENEK